jgi:hypothetical protein
MSRVNPDRLAARVNRNKPDNGAIDHPSLNATALVVCLASTPTRAAPSATWREFSITDNPGVLGVTVRLMSDGNLPSG